VTTAGQFGASTDNITPADSPVMVKLTSHSSVPRPANGLSFVRKTRLTLHSRSGQMAMFLSGRFRRRRQIDATVFRPSTSKWFVVAQTDGGATIPAVRIVGGCSVPGDYDGDGKADIAIYRPSLGQWWSSRSSGGVIVLTFGGASDKPVQGDFTGDGKTDIAIWRPSTGEWFS
jgi:hypothetical protein